MSARLPKDFQYRGWQIHDQKSKSQNGIVAWAELPKPFEEKIEL